MTSDKRMRLFKVPPHQVATNRVSSIEELHFGDQEGGADGDLK